MEEFVKFLKTQGRYNDFLDVIRLDFNLKNIRDSRTYMCIGILGHMVHWGPSKKTTGIDWAELHRQWFISGRRDCVYTHAEVYALKKDDGRISKMLKFSMWVDELRAFLIDHGVYEEFLSLDCPEWYRPSRGVRSIINGSVDWDRQKKATGTNWEHLHDLWVPYIKNNKETIDMSHDELIEALTIEDTKIIKIFKGIRKLRPLH